MRFALTLASAGLLLLPACKSAEEVTVLLQDQCSFQDTATYTEFAVFEDQCSGGSTACGLDDKLSVGDTDGAIFRHIVPMGDALPSVGKLDEKAYAFAAIVRDESCRVIGYGCTCADITTIREVQVQPGGWSRCQDKDCTLDEFCASLETGGCAADEQCTAGTCEAGISDVDSGPDEPTVCTLEVQASGALPSVAAETRLTGPALAATSSGFVLAYRTQDAEGIADIVASLPSTSGALTPIPPAKIACAYDEIQADGGIGIDFKGGNGLAVFSLPNCDGKGAGATFTTFDAAGTVGTTNLQPNAGFASLTLAPHHSIASRPADGERDFLFRSAAGAGQVSIAVLQGAGFKAGGNVDKLFDAMDYAMVARDKSIVSYVGRASASTTVLVGAPTAAIGEMGVVALDPVDVVTMSALDDQVFVATSVASVDGLSWSLYGADAKQADTGTAGNLTYGSSAASWFQDSPLVAAGAVDRIDVHWIGAETSLIRVAGAAAPVAGFAGKLLASASGEDQVAVAWLTDATVSTGALGGWAVLGCAAPGSGSGSGGGAGSGSGGSAGTASGGSGAGGSGGSGTGASGGTAAGGSGAAAGTGP